MSEKIKCHMIEIRAVDNGYIMEARCGDARGFGRIVGRRVYKSDWDLTSELREKFEVVPPDVDLSECKGDSRDR